MKIHIITLLLITYLISCKTEDKKLTIINYSDLTSSSAILELNDFAANLTYVPLETSPECMLSNVMKIQAGSDYIYVLNVNPFGIYRFDSHGKFISKIGAEGRAPGEYIAPTDIYLDEQAQKFYIADVFAGILVYSADGIYITTLPQSRSNNNFIITPDNNLLINPVNVFGKNKYQLVEQNTQGDTIATILNHHKFNTKTAAIYPAHTSLVKSGNEIIFHPQLSDTLYTYNHIEKNITPTYIFKFQDGITNDVLEDFMNNILKVQFVSYITDGGKYLYVSVFDKNWQEKLYAIDKKTNKKYKTDFRLGQGFESEFLPKWQNEGYLIGIFEPASLSYTDFHKITEEARENAYQFFREKNININEESNPVLIKLNIKP